jgi:hypothetical protein
LFTSSLSLAISPLFRATIEFAPSSGLVQTILHPDTGRFIASPGHHQSNPFIASRAFIPSQRFPSSLKFVATRSHHYSSPFDSTDKISRSSSFLASIACVISSLTDTPKFHLSPVFSSSLDFHHPKPFSFSQLLTDSSSFIVSHYFTVSSSFSLSLELSHSISFSTSNTHSHFSPSTGGQISSNSSILTGSSDHIPVNPDARRPSSVSLTGLIVGSLMVILVIIAICMIIWFVVRRQTSQEDEFQGQYEVESEIRELSYTTEDSLGSADGGEAADEIEDMFAFEQGESIMPFPE